LATTANGERLTLSLNRGQDAAKVTSAMRGNNARFVGDNKEAGSSGIAHDSVGEEECTVSADRKASRNFCQLLPDNDKTLS